MAGAGAIPDPRAALVSNAISRFTSEHQMEVARTAQTFILDKVLRPPAEYETGLRARQFEESFVEETLFRTLAVAGSDATRRGLKAVDPQAVEFGAIQIIQSELGCPFPFWFC